MVASAEWMNHTTVEYHMWKNFGEFGKWQAIHQKISCQYYKYSKVTELTGLPDPNSELSTVCNSRSLPSIAPSHVSTGTVMRLLITSCELAGIIDCWQICQNFPVVCQNFIFPTYCAQLTEFTNIKTQFLYAQTIANLKQSCWILEVILLLFHTPHPHTLKLGRKEWNNFLYSKQLYVYNCTLNYTKCTLYKLLFCVCDSLLHVVVQKCLVYGDTAVIRCHECRATSYLCGLCDQEIHHNNPLHDREYWNQEYFSYIPPTLAPDNLMRELIEVGMYVHVILVHTSLTLLYVVLNSMCRQIYCT